MYELYDDNSHYIHIYFFRILEFLTLLHLLILLDILLITIKYKPNNAIFSIQFDHTY